jgi:hypothetical protein
MAAALALKETASIYEGVLERPNVDPSADYARQVKVGIDAAERLVRSRKIKAISERMKVNEQFEALHASGRAIPEDVKQQLDETIAAVAQQVEEHAAAVEMVKRDSRHLLEKVRVVTPENFKVATKEISRFIEYGKEMHSDIVDMYYFLLSLKSGIDPEASAGPSFDNPDELKTFLDNELAD